jgi:hypothetical protein
MDDEPPFAKSPTAIRLGISWDDYCDLCRMSGMTEKEMLKHLLNQRKLQEAGSLQRTGEN